jgi:hypothetical protein
MGVLPETSMCEWPVLRCDQDMMWNVDERIDGTNECRLEKPSDSFVEVYLEQAY